MTDTQCPPLTGSLLDQVHIRKAVRSDLREIEWEGEYQRFRGVYADVFARTNRGLAIMWVAELCQQGLAGQAFVQLKMTDRSCADGRKRAVSAFLPGTPGIPGTRTGYCHHEPR